MRPFSEQLVLLITEDLDQPFVPPFYVLPFLAVRYAEVGKNPVSRLGLNASESYSRVLNSPEGLNGQIDSLSEHIDERQGRG